MQFMIKSSLAIQGMARAEFCTQYLPVNYLRLKKIQKAKKQLVSCCFHKSVGRCLGLPLNSSQGKVTSIMMEMQFSLKRLELAPVRDSIAAWTDSGSDAGWQLFCSAVKCLCTKESWWDKQVSSGNALPPAKVICHFDEVHDNISVLQTCFFPTEYDVFSKPYKPVILPAWRKNTQGSQSF